MVKATHSAAAQVAVAALLVSAVLLGLPAFAEETAMPISAPAPIDTFFAGKVITQFQRQGLVSSYDNTSLQTSVFDFQGYMRDICFDPTPYDMTMCETKYGPYANLKNALMNGELLSMLKLYGLFDDADSDLVRAVQSQVKAGSVPAPTEVSSSGVNFSQNVAERSAEVWRVCKNRYSDDASGLRDCFQRNQRLVTRIDVPVQGNIH